MAYSKEDKKRDSYYRRTYGIGLSEYNRLRRLQRYACPICERPETVVGRLCVDHDHKTGEIFGLLCNYCNHRVVGRNHHYPTAERIMKYLKKGTGWFVPKKVPKKRRRKRK